MDSFKMHIGLRFCENENMQKYYKNSMMKCIRFRML